jgi:hypothetical protein
MLVLNVVSRMKIPRLWHKRLGHISRERLLRLVKDGILLNLDFFDLGMCVDCIKGKQIKHTRKGATRSTELLEIIHTDICGPFDNPSFGGEKYFITFIDDFSRRTGFPKTVILHLSIRVGDSTIPLPRSPENCDDSSRNCFFIWVTNSRN